MKENGFIATSLIYSFFIAFVSLVAVILGTYSYYRGALNKLNSNVLSSLNNRISNKYILLTNLVENGSFENDLSTYDFTGVTMIENKPGDMNNPVASGFKSLQLNSVSYNGNMPQNKNAKLIKRFQPLVKYPSNQQYYVRFKMFKNGRIMFNNPQEKAYVKLNNNCGTADTRLLTLGDQNNDSNFAFSNWQVMSFITDTIPLSESELLNLEFYVANEERLREADIIIENTHTGLLTDYSIYIDEIMVIDVTALKQKLNVDEKTLKNRLDGANCGNDSVCLKQRLNYFEGTYSYQTY